MKKLRIQDIDVVYLSYDEPRSDEFYADLKKKCPWAKRVHGVKGFDNAHKACANAADTPRVITVDADNIVKEEFFRAAFDVPEEQFGDCVFSWAGLNAVNGLMYGNGGLKCWPVEFIMNMRTHENADEDDETVDFCWDDKYVQMNESYSETYPNGSPFQAFRSGFREGVKMTLDRGHRVTLNEIDNEKLWHGNVKRLEIWCSVGMDVENGPWSLYGTRLGTYMTNLTDWNHNEIADYDWFDKFWEQDIRKKFKGDSKYCRYTDYGWDERKLDTEIVRIGDKLRRSMGLRIAELDRDASRFFKHVYVAPSRTGYS